MNIRTMLMISGMLLSLPVGFAEGIPALRVREVKTPWGTAVERVSYYLQDGEEIQHGADEMFSDAGGLQIRARYKDGEPDGLYQIFYDGIGTKQTETMYAGGNEHGISRTWSPVGELLFEGTWKNGEKWDGWFERGSSSSSGVYHRREETWKIVQWKDGKRVRGSMRLVKAKWRDWVPGSSPDFDLFCRWRWSQPKNPEGYAYLSGMPPYREVPSLIDQCAKKAPCYEVAWDQLMALTRVNFGNPWLQSDDERLAAMDEWQKWWDDVGRHRTEQRKLRGVRDEEAWEIVRGDRDLPLPELAVVIPDSYHLTARFSSGDYLGVTSETVTIKRSADHAELVRSFSTLRDGPVTEERWMPFSPKEADQLVRAIGYLVDQPWLLNDEKEIERRCEEAEKNSPKSDATGTYGDDLQKGRESYGQLYYPDTGYELRDGGGMLWWNADVDDWSGGNPERFNHSQQAAPGVVFPFLARTYPETDRRENGAERGWGNE